MKTSFAQGWRFGVSGAKTHWSILIVCTLVFLTMLAGCASNKSGTYPTLKQTDTHVSWEMTRFREAEMWGHLTADEKQRGNAAYRDYKRAYDEAVRAANGNRQAGTPDDVKALANEAIRVLSSLPTDLR